MKKIKKKVYMTMLLVSLFAAQLNVCYAVSDPLEGISNLETLLFSIVSAIGGVILLWSIVQLGIAIKKHDPAATTEAILGIVAGLCIACAPWIVSYITG